MSNAKTRPETSHWKRIIGRFLDLIYPCACRLCGSELHGGRYLCDDCWVALPRLRAPFCATCGEMFDGEIDAEFDCPNCRDTEFAFEFARPAMAHDPQTRELIHDLKYHRGTHMARDLARLAVSAFDDPRLQTALAEAWPLVPVPLHWQRLRSRHFNQAEEIARALSRLTGQTVVRALKRTRSTATQTRLSRHQRQKNLHGAFAVTRPGKSLTQAPGVVLIDDVFTTGSTVHECARILRKAGLQKVVVVTVMRG
jgi:competence protein ComFC